MQQIAEQIRPGDPLTRHQMMERIHERQYTLAAQYFFLSPGLTDGDKNRALVAPLETYDISKISALAAMAQLLWSTRASSVAEKVRRYFIDLALTEYDAALAMNMETVVTELTGDVTFSIERDAERNGRAGPDDERLSLGKYLEAFEPRFYELMRVEQEKLQKDR